jgi:hypothetical protein
MSRSYHITRRSAAARAAAGDGDDAVKELTEKQIVKHYARKHGHEVKNSFLVRAVRRVKKG